MRTFWIAWLLMVFVAAAPAEEKQEPKKEKLVYVLTNTKGAITDTKPWVTLRLFRHMPFEFLAKQTQFKKPYYTARFLNGETLWIKGQDSTLMLMVVKPPALKTQKAIYKKMMHLDKIAEAAAKKRGSGMTATSKKYFKQKFLRQYYVQVVLKYKLTYGMWQKIKSSGDAGWPAPKKATDSDGKKAK